MLEVRNITKTYEGQLLLRGISFTLETGQTICLLGRSGSGKSTLLRIIAGLETPESGQVLWQGQDLANTPAHQRHFGLMFQDYALFPHRNVSQNIAFGLRMQGLPAAEIETQVAAALAQVNLTRFARRNVTDLSGGEQQRVALARALAPRPHLLMLDEPLGALDRALREQLVQELHQLLKETRIPAIYVTHDQEEAFALADRLILLHDGRVEQSGTPAEVYRAPASAWAARFLGFSNLLPGQVTQRDPLRVRTALGEFTCARQNQSAGQAVTVLLRPTGAGISAAPSDPNQICGVVSDVIFHGDSYRVTLQPQAAAQPALEFQLGKAAQPGERLCLTLPPESIDCLEADHEP